MVIAEGVLDELLKFGATLAGEGEFTKRAFLNGKLSLEAAEGVIDMINATSEAEVRAGYNLLNGELFKEVNRMQKKLTTVLAQMEVAIDYPEHDIDYKTIKMFNDKLTDTKDILNKLLSTTKTGRLIKDGINVAILGRPNVGKSSLMNALLNYDRAIVTNIAGTTRDTLEESYSYKGIKINLIDTAGLRKTKETVEKLGIDRAYKTLDYADVVLVVLDGSENLTEQDQENLKLVKNKKHIVVQNKADLKQNINLQNVHKLSAVTKEGIQELKDEVYNLVIDSKVIKSSVLITNKRHEEALKNSLESIDIALNSLSNAETLDLVTIDIKEAWTLLGKITGETSDENIIDEIFSKFCLGK